MEVKQAEFVISNTKLEKCPSNGLPEYAFIGRSNVGKSSLINMLTNRKSLALISSKPGKTQTINHFIINNEWYLVDLPGYGFATRGKATRDIFGLIITDYISNRLQLTNLFVLIDSRLKPQKIDLEFIEWLGENEVAFSIVFTKVDKISQTKMVENIELFKESLFEIWEELPPMFITSSEEKKGKEELLDYVDSINKSLKKK